MEIALPARLSILDHPQRLIGFEALLRRYPDQVPAGERAKVPGLKASTLSACLSPSARGSGSPGACRQITVYFCRAHPAQHRNDRFTALCPQSVDRIALQQKTDDIGRTSTEEPT